MGSAACTQSVTLHVTSDVPARLSHDTGSPCEALPCELTISRETCFFFDSSSGYVALTAETASQRLQAPFMVTCDIPQGRRLNFQFLRRPCSVTVQDPGAAAQRYEPDCTPLKPASRPNLAPIPE